MEESEVSDLLATLPCPAMPPQVLADIEDRLAEERKVVPITPRHTRRLNWLVAAAAVLGFLVLVGLGGTRPAPAPVAAGEPVVRTGASFGPTGFADQLRDRLTVTPTSGPTQTFADSVGSIQGCATAVQAYGRVMFLDVGTYDRTAAVVMVTSFPANTDYEEVWVVSPACGPSDHVVYRHMIYDVDGSVTRSV